MLESTSPQSTGGRVINAVGTAGLVAASVILAIIIVELFCYFFIPSIGRANIYEWDRRIMFFDGAGTIFQNHENIFTYVPHNDVRDMTVYFSDKSYSIEFDYRFHTNNYGC
jgi:hypothetical protein